MDRISALMDGELDENEVSQLFSRLKPQGEMRESWDTFHLISDALRGDCCVSPHLKQRIAERLAAEPTVLAPRRRTTAKRVNTYVLSAAASLSAVALVVWVALFSINPLSTPQQEMAKAQISPVRPVPAPDQIAGLGNLSDFSSQGNLNEYMLAHQGFSPSTAIQGVVPYIRSVSDSRPSR